MVEIIAEIIKPLLFLISFISNGNYFPKPMSASEEKEYIKKYKEGDINAKNELIERNLRLVAHIAKKYSSVTSDTDDLISVGTIGLIKGVESYNFDKGKRLVSYVSRCIENEILMLLRCNKKLSAEVSLSEPIGSDKEGNRILLMDVLGCEDENFAEELEKKNNIKKLRENIKNKLTNREREIIELRYGMKNGKCYTQREVGKMLDISRSYVSRIEKKAVEKLGAGIVEKY